MLLAGSASLFKLLKRQACVVGSAPSAHIDSMCACRRRAIERSDDEDDDPDDLEDDQLDEEEGDNEVDGVAASVSGLGEASSMANGLPSKEDDAVREVQRQRNLEQALFIQMEMQKKLHEQLEVNPRALSACCQANCTGIIVQVKQAMLFAMLFAMLQLHHMHKFSCLLHNSCFMAVLCLLSCAVQHMSC